MTRILSLLPAALLLVSLMIPPVFAQGDYHDRARSLVSQTDKDLRKISRSAIEAKDRERYEEALRRLSEFDKEMARGKYEKDKLDEAIERVDKITKENTLSPDARDTLLNDLRDLRELRSAWR
jgi:hypothetical protein